MATLGNNTVISADEKLHPWLNEWVKGKTGFWLFEQHNYFELNDKRMDFGYNHDVKYYDCYPILTKNYFGHEQELVDRANSQIGYDDPNEFAE